MKVLIDTNIIIHREASRIINKDIGLLFNWLDRLHYEKCIHPLSIEEISTYRDSKVVETIHVKAQNYNILKTISNDTAAITELRKSDVTQNDKIDTDILKEVFNNRVDFLITEDRGIHNKAKKLGIAEKVFKIDDFLEKCITENPSLKDYNVLAVKKEYFGNIPLDDDFFDSFKEDYSEFEAWYNKKSDNVSYVCKTDDKISAFLYLKIESADENYTDIQPIFEPKKRLKIGTFKVVSSGLKLGERFLKIIFDNALQYSVEEIYVTIFDKREEQKRLILLLEDWGFQFWGKKKTTNGTELVYVRNFKKHFEEDNPRLSYPFVTKRKTKWIVPIYPDYHTELFPDSILNNESPEDFTESEPHRNAIKKVYISRSINRNLECGDIILFYRTGGHYKGVISTLGIVESVLTNIPNENKFIELCRKRSVFDNDGLRNFWNYNRRNRPFIVNFLYVDSFPKPKVNLKRLRELNLLQDAPRGFEIISAEKFEVIEGFAKPPNEW